MDYEKKYKNALEWARRVMQGKVGFVLDEVLEKFPELQESEDEKIRKRLVEEMRHFQREAAKESCDIDFEFAKSAIAWLEKQGKPNPQSDLTPKNAMEAINEEKVDNANKVEPKFKVGNWYQCTKDFFGKGVTFDKATAYYCAEDGCLQDEYGCHIAIVKDLYDNFKSWTIQDAKDGDVLANDHHILILKELVYEWFFNGTPDSVNAHCGIKPNGNFEIGKDGWCFCGTLHIHPATKEQRDLLFTKMKEAGYEWDVEKKELRKIEPKPAIEQETPEDFDLHKTFTAWSEEDEQAIEDAETWLDTLCDYLKDSSSECIPTVKNVISKLKSLKEKCAWKPSDEQIQALEYQIHSTYESSWQYKASKELLEQLKQLREKSYD